MRFFTVIIAVINCSFVLEGQSGIAPHQKISPESRAIELINTMAGQLPALVQCDTFPELSAPVHDVSVKQDVTALEGTGRLIDMMSTSQHAPASDQVILAWLDTLRRHWNVASDTARWVYLLNHDNIEWQLGPVLMSGAAIPALRPALSAFASAAVRAAEQATNVRNRAILAVLGHTVAGKVFIASGDTARALKELFAVVRTPRTSTAQAFAGPMLVQITQAGLDTAQHLLALTFRQLTSGVVTTIERQLYTRNTTRASVDTQLRLLYERYSAVHGTPPDLVPARLRDEPRPSNTLSFDGYLDRQWIGLYDREFAVIPAQPSAAGSSQHRRLVVVEYYTDLTCSGCWHDDMGLQPLRRRYPSDRVLTLAYHATEPAVVSTDSLLGRMLAWYPSTYRKVQDWRPNTRHVQIPLSTLFTAQGDTLMSDILVDGKGIARPTRSWSQPGGLGYYNAAVSRIDQELLRPPEAAVTLSARWTHDRAAVTVQTTRHSLNGHPVAVRIFLVEDTVWIRGMNIRRIYQNVIRSVASNDTLSLGLPLQDATVTTTHYTFDVATIEANISKVRNPQWWIANQDESPEKAQLFADYFRFGFPDSRDWRINRHRLSVVAIIQDMMTGHVLQAAQSAIVGEPIS